MGWIFRYENKDFNLDVQPPKKNININWGRTGDRASSMHSISSYLAMFAPALPMYFIDKYSKKGDLIFDPFSGRGTTALKAREMNRCFVGSDLNPYAIVLSRSKIAIASKNEILNAINEMENKFLKWKVKNKFLYRRVEYKELLYFYSPMVLTQLIFIREIYGRKWKTFDDVYNLIFGFTFGLMHGPSRKDGSTLYFSLKMPNTISMSPNYVLKFSKNNNLKKPRLNVFAHITDRVNAKYDEIISKKFNGKLLNQNALDEYKEISNSSVDLLISSPPYLNIVNYTNSNWLKLWLLGFDRKKVKNIKLSDKMNFNSYTVFITRFLNNIYPKMKNGSHVCLIVGDVYDQRLMELVWNTIQNNVKFKLIDIYWDTNYSQQKKITNMLNAKKGKATTIEKVLVLRKEENAINKI